MLFFVDDHLLEDGLALCVCCRQFFKVIFQMFTDLLLGFSHKSQAPSVAGDSRGGTDAV